MSRIINRQQCDDPSVPSAPPAYNPVVVHESNITKYQLQQVLRSKKTTGGFTCLQNGEKRKIIDGIIKHKQAITTALEAVDNFNSRNSTDSMYQQQFNLALHSIDSRSILRATNVELGDMLIDLFSVFQATNDHPKMRSLDQQIKICIKCLTDKMDQVVQYIISECENKNEPSKLLLGVSRTREQLARGYLQDGGSFPRDESHQNCVFCNHTTVDEPPENKDVIGTNQERLAKHRLATEQWKKFHDGKGPCPKTSSGKVYTRKPPPPKMDALLLQCHCHQMVCARKGSDFGSTCIIGCKKHASTTGTSLAEERYPWIDAACSCPICKCKCKKTYQIDKIGLIGLEIMAKQPGSGTISGISKEEREKIDQALGKKYFAECMIEGAKVAAAAMNTIDNMNSNGK